MINHTYQPGISCIKMATKVPKPCCLLLDNVHRGTRALLLIGEFKVAQNAINASIPARIQNLKLPHQGPVSGVSARQADLELLANAPSSFLDTTHFDTVRFPPPTWALECFTRAAVDGTQAYSGYRGHPAVLDRVADSVSQFLGFEVDASQQLMLTPGTQAGLFAGLAASVQAGARVAVFDPDYLFTARILRFLDCDVAYVPLRTTGDEYGPDLNLLEGEFANQGTRQLVFSHPNNPTGAVFSPSMIKQIAELVKKYDVRVVVDELYSRLVYGNASFPHLAAEPEMFDRVVTLLGPSKTESLSGFRIGVVVGSSETLQAAENVLAITALRAPAYAQHVLLPWLNSDQAWLEERMLALDGLRQLTQQKFSKLPWLKVFPCDATAYAWIDVSALGLSDSVIAEALLVRAGVLVSPGYQFGPSGKGHFRVCFARDESQWSAAIDRIIAALSALAAE